MVAPKNGDPSLEPDLEEDEQGYALDTEVPPVDIVSQKEVVGIRTVATYFEQFDHVVELAMDVAADGHWTVHYLYIRFFH